MERWRARRPMRSIHAMLAVLAVLAVVLAGTGLGAGAMGGPPAQTRPQGIDSCTTIDESGTYALVGNINATGVEDGEACISITASDVTLQGTGHTLTGTNTGSAIKADGSAERLTGVTVENVKTTDWSIGVYYLDVADGRIENVVATNTTQGITLARAPDNVVAGTTAVDNAIGIAVGEESTDNVIRGTVATRNKWGIHFERRSDNNTVTDNAAWNNSEWDYYSTIDAGDNPVTNLRVGSATIGLESRTIGARGVESPPASPEGQRSLGRYVRVIDTREDARLSLTMHYGEGAGEATPVLWRYADDSWARVTDPQVFPENRTVTAMVPTSGIYGLFVPGANPGPNATATAAPQSLPDANTTLAPVESVQAVTPTPEPGATTTIGSDVNVTRTADGNGTTDENGIADGNGSENGSGTADGNGTTDGNGSAIAGTDGSNTTSANGTDGTPSTGEGNATSGTDTGNTTDETEQADPTANATATTRAPGTANAGGDTSGGSLLGPIAALATAVVAVAVAGLLTVRRSRRGPRRRR